MMLLVGTPSNPILSPYYTPKLANSFKAAIFIEFSIVAKNAKSSRKISDQNVLLINFHSSLKLILLFLQISESLPALKIPTGWKWSND